MLNKFNFLLLVLLFSTNFAKAQEAAEDMRVLYCTAIEKDVAVQNIYVDANNTKLVANSNGLYEIYSADNAGKRDLAGQWGLLRQRGGNFPFQVATDNVELKKMKAIQTFETEEGKTKVNATFYDKKNKQLWIGTTDSGLYCYKTSRDDFRLLKHYDADNSKLSSNKINSIFVDKYARLWVGTGEGVLMQEKEKWRLYEKDTEIFSIVPDKINVWIMGAGFFWKVDDRNHWMIDKMDERLSRGKIRDIAYDSKGKLWVASDIITRFDVLNDKVEVYDSSNGFTANNINCIKVDKDDALWVGTDQGLFLIEREATMTITCVVEKELSCTGNTDDASLLVKVLGGMPPYRYEWDGALSGPNPQAVGAGLFTVTVTDDDGLVKTAAAKIEDKRMRVEIASTADAKDGKNNGKAEVNVTGGVPGFRYKWDSGETKARASRLTAGAHQVTISDNNDCEYVATVQIGGAILAATNPSSSNASDLKIDFDISKELDCAADNTASITLNVEGGTAPYTYKWNQAGLEGNQLSDLGAGDYEVTVTDAKGKLATQNIYLEAPDPIVLTAIMDKPATSDRKRDGIVHAQAKGGKGGFKYEWSNSVQKAKTFDLAVGKYTVTATDESGCTATASVNVSKQINTALASKNIRKGQIIRLEKLYFEADSTQITDLSLPTLNEMVSFMEANPKITIEIGGHTNGVPAHEYCDKLSSARAKSVTEYLVLRGVNTARVKYRGYGKRKPIASNNTAAGRKRNQRVEVKVLEVGT